MNRTEFIGTNLYYSQDFVDDLKQEIERLNNIIKKGITEEMKDELDLILKTNQKQAYRINKAIEYIENYLCSDEYIQSDINSIANAFVKLVDILKGDNKE